MAGSLKGSNILLEAILEVEVAHNAKDFFSQPQNQINSHGYRGNVSKSLYCLTL